ncbi:MAG: hypothetical protein R6V32_03785, partial [Bacteroidales bacterium]
LHGGKQEFIANHSVAAAKPQTTQHGRISGYARAQEDILSCQIFAVILRCEKKHLNLSLNFSLCGHSSKKR